MRLSQAAALLIVNSAACLASTFTLNFFENNGVDLILSGWTGPPMAIHTIPSIEGQMLYAPSLGNLILIYPFVSPLQECVFVVHVMHGHQRWVCDAREEHESLLEIDENFTIVNKENCYQTRINENDEHILQIAYNTIR